MLTADTITDEQIRELSLFDDAGVRRWANRAQHALRQRERRLARARCAEILNARNGAKP